MDNSLSIETFRSLAQIEGDMKKAERAFLGADTRLDEAEARLQEAEQQFREAKQARETSLRALDQCHAEIDRTLAMLREASPIGSKWKSRAGLDAEALMPTRKEAFDASSDFILKN